MELYVGGRPLFANNLGQHVSIDPLKLLERIVVFLKMLLGGKWSGHC